MDAVISSVLNIMFYPFVSQSLFVTIPFAFCFVAFVFVLIKKLMRL